MRWFDEMKNNNPLNISLKIVTILSTIFILCPALLSVTAGLEENYSKGWRSGLTLKWLGEVWINYGDTVFASILLALCTVIGTILIGLPGAYALSRTKSKFASLFEEVLTLPVAVPGLATSLALILAYGQIRGFRQSFLFIWVGHMVFTLPFMVRSVAASFRRPELIAIEEAASTLGASFIQKFIGVLIPSVLPAILSGSLIVFTLSIGEFNLTWMLHTPLTRTLPVGLADSYASMRIEIGSAYTILFYVVVLPLIWLLQLIAAMAEKKYAT